MKPLDILLYSLDIISESRIWKDKKPSEILKILIYLYNKKWLYTPTIDGKVIAVIGAYRVEGISDEILSKIPDNEQGKILYIPFAISLNKNDNIFRVARKCLKEYAIKNPDVLKMAIEGKDDRLRIYNIGVLNGKDKRPELTTNAAIH